MTFLKHWKKSLNRIAPIFHWAFGVWCLVIFSSTAFAEIEIPLPVPRQTLEVGEQFIFDVFWMGVPVGEGSLEVKEKTRVRGREAFHIVAIAKTNDFLSRFYPIYDQVHSYVDVERFCSLEFSKKVREGNYRADEKIIFDPEKKKGFYESLKNGSRKEVETPSEVQDMLSAFYWFRRQAIQVGKSARTVISADEQNWDLEIEVLRRETKEFRNGSVIETVVVEPQTRLKGILYKRGRAWVYFSADEERIPVWVTIRTPFGPVFGVLRR